MIRRSHRGITPQVARQIVSGEVKLTGRRVLCLEASEAPPGDPFVRIAPGVWVRRATASAQLVRA